MTFYNTKVLYAIQKVTQLYHWYSSWLNVYLYYINLKIVMCYVMFWIDGMEVHASFSKIKTYRE